MTRARPAAAVLAMAIALAATHAAGDAATEARYFDDRARAEFARRHYAEALALFLQVHEIAPSAGTLYNIGVSAALAREPALAYAHFEEFVASPGADAARRADAERRMHELEASLARVRVESDPPGATVWVDRRELGEWGRTPRTLVLEPGPHEIELSREGHVARRVSVTATRGRVSEVRETLEAERGSLRVEVVPPAARVLVTGHDGAAREVVSGEAIELPVGSYAIVAELDGHRSDRREITVRAGALDVVRLAPTPIPRPTGRVLASSGSVRASVVVDGAVRGETPARIDGVSEGDHEIEISADGYLPWRGTVRVEAGRGAFVDVTLIPAR